MSWDYDKLVTERPILEKVVSPELLSWSKDKDKTTVQALGDDWVKNINENVYRYWKNEDKLPNETDKYGLACVDLLGAAKGKAALFIGAGPSLNENKHILKKILNENGAQPFHNQAFFSIACNHMGKNLIEEGIYPHAVYILDAGEHLKPQMQIDHEAAEHTILLATINTHPECIAAWKGPVRFIIPTHHIIQDALENATQDEYKSERSGGSVFRDGLRYPQWAMTVEGGNVGNMVFSFSFTQLQSTVFMIVGQDLSSEAVDDDDERRSSHYADGDYSTNKESGRDEASHKKAYAGFKFTNSKLVNADGSDRKLIDLELRYTSPQFISYKTWAEISWASLFYDNMFKFQIYNCSERGILGVVEKPGMTRKERFDIKNYQMLDTVLPGAYRTRTLEQGAFEFLHARSLWMEQFRRKGLFTDVKDTNKMSKV